MKRMISDLMKDYFDEAASTAPHPHQVRNLINESAYHNLPVNAAPSRGEWETVDSPRRLMKEFSFSSQSILINFVSEVLRYQEESQHHGKLTISHGKVIIEVYTHDVNDITELDIEYAQSTDKISQDVMFYNYNQDF